MSTRFNGKLALFLAVMLLVLAGCFRQAGDEIAPTLTTTTQPTTIPTDPALAASPSPFITPFDPDSGLDSDALPTLTDADPTVSLATPDPDAPSEDPTAAPAVNPTVPFATGPTFTPIPGQPSFTPEPEDQGLITNTPSVAEAEATESAPDPRGCVHVVQPGETAYLIALDNNITLVELIEANQLENPDRLFEGQELQIPGCGEGTGSDDAADDTPPDDTPPDDTPPDNTPPEPTAPPAPTINAEGQVVHVVQSGENLYRISLRYGVTVQQIVDANGLGTENAILSIGQELIIPIAPEDLEAQTDSGA